MISSATTANTTTIAMGDNIVNIKIIMMIKIITVITNNNNTKNYILK